MNPARARKTARRRRGRRGVRFDIFGWKDGWGEWVVEVKVV